MIKLGPICHYCKHSFLPKKCACAAYPDEIPIDIYAGRDNHRKHRFRDHGIQFELKPDLSEESKRAFYGHFEPETYRKLYGDHPGLPDKPKA